MEHPSAEACTIRSEVDRRLTAIEENSHPHRYEDFLIGELDRSRNEAGGRDMTLAANLCKARASGLDREYMEAWAGRLGLTDVWQAILRRTSS